MSSLDTYDAILSRRLGTTSENFHSDESRTSAINLAVNEFTDEYKPEEFRKKAYVDFERYGNSVDAMEYANDAAAQAVWGAIVDDANLPTVDSDCKIGAVATSFGATFAAGSASWTASGTLTSDDYSDYTGVKIGTPAEGFVGFWMKMSDNTAFTNIRFFIGNDAANRAVISLTMAEDDEWNYYELDLTDFTITGSPDWRTIDYAAFDASFTSSVSILVDDIKIIPKNLDYMIATMPSDLSTMNRILKVENVSTGKEFVTSDPDEFYRRQGDRITFDYSEVSSAKRLFIYDTTIERLLVHYIMDPAAMTGGSSDSGLNSTSDEAVALLALRRLLINEGAWDKVEVLNDREIRDALSTWQGVRGNVSKRLKSKYERVSYHAR